MQLRDTKHIAVLLNGFVYVGNVELHDDWLTLTDAVNVRRWGTQKGLGQLVDGPTSQTILDKVGEVIVPKHALLHLIPTKPRAW